MELKMTASEFMNEDGHGKRDADFVSDDMWAIVSAKRDITDSLSLLTTIVPDFDAIAFEQELDDMIFRKWNALCEEGGITEPLPKSKAYKAWLARGK